MGVDRERWFEMSPTQRWRWLNTRAGELPEWVARALGYQQPEVVEIRVRCVKATSWPEQLGVRPYGFWPGGEETHRYLEGFAELELRQDHNLDNDCMEVWRMSRGGVVGSVEVEDLQVDW
jgi:hypothetical protein